MRQAAHRYADMGKDKGGRMKKKAIIIDASDGVTAEEVSEAARVLAGGTQPLPQPSPVDTGEGVSDGSDLGDGQWQQYTWRGEDGLRCVMCEWDTLEGLEAAREHARVCPRCAPRRIRLPIGSTMRSNRRLTVILRTGRTDGTGKLDTKGVVGAENERICYCERGGSGDDGRECQRSESGDGQRQ
jgi:hypothetical protein